MPFTVATSQRVGLTTWSLGATFDRTLPVILWVGLDSVRITVSPIRYVVLSAHSLSCGDTDATLD
jgi:hypothetical protein